MTHMTMTSRGALLLSLLLVQGMAFAAPPLPNTMTTSGSPPTRAG